MSTETSQVPASPSGLRSDARQNRDRILGVARELFAQRGLDVPMAAIARHAEVGVATLYRRFPTKEALIVEAFTEQFGVCAAVVYDALDDPDPWRGFRTVIEKVCEMQATDRGFTAAFLAALPDAIDVSGERDRALRGFAELVDRAKAAGRLRVDFAPEDLILLFMANNGIVADSADLAKAASRRLTAYLLNSFRADHADPADPLPPPAPLSVHDLP
jgi:AcrR family transcriptional regulator